MLVIVNAPPGVNAPGVLFSAKTSIFRSKRPLVKQKRKNRPGHTANAPPIYVHRQSRRGAFAHLSWAGDLIGPSLNEFLVAAQPRAKTAERLLCVLHNIARGGSPSARGRLDSSGSEQGNTDVSGLAVRRKTVPRTE